MGVDARGVPGGLLRLDPAFAYVEPPSSWPLSRAEYLTLAPNRPEFLSCVCLDSSVSILFHLLWIHARLPLTGREHLYKAGIPWHLKWTCQMTKWIEPPSYLLRGNKFQTNSKVYHFDRTKERETCSWIWWEEAKLKPTLTTSSLTLWAMPSQKR